MKKRIILIICLIVAIIGIVFGSYLLINKYNMVVFEKNIANKPL